MSLHICGKGGKPVAKNKPIGGSGTRIIEGNCLPVDCI